MFNILDPFSATPKMVETIKKNISEIVRKNKLEVTIDANLKTVVFLDITMDLQNDTFRPFIKPNTVPLYINCQSNPYRKSVIGILSN